MYYDSISDVQRSQGPVTRSKSPHSEPLDLSLKSNQLQMCSQTLRSRTPACKSVRTAPTVPKKSCRSHWSTGGQSHPEHQEDKSLKCQKCAFWASSAHDLYRHMKCEHPQAKPYQCVTCGLWFNTFHDCRVHAYTVQKSEVLECDQCNFSTYNNFHLSNHMHTHSNTKLQCKHCDVSLSSKGALQEHLKCHFDESVYPCGKCNKVYASALLRKIHIIDKYGLGYTCLEYTKHFDSTSQLAKHRQHCGKGARSNSPEY